MTKIATLTDEGVQLTKRLDDAEAKVSTLESEKNGLSLGEKALGEKVSGLEESVRAAQAEKERLEKELEDERTVSMSLGP